MAGIDPKTTMDRARQRRNGIRTSGQVNARVDRVERTDLLAPSGLIEKITGITEPSYIKFTNTPALPSAGWVEGHLYWDADWDILSVRLNDDVDMHLGMSIYMPPTNNNSGVTIPRGSFVMATGVLGDRITIAKAVTDGSVAPDYMIGVAAHDIANGDTDGKIVTQGEVRGFDTSAYVVGTILYPDPTTPGGWTSTKPTAPNIRVSVAYVTRQHVNTGRIMVRTHQGSVLGGTDQNVKFGTLVDNDVVTWDNAQQLWVNEPASANALPGISGTGIVVRSATTPSYLTRTLTGTSNQITVTNDTGVSGNPTISLPSAITAPGSMNVTGKLYAQLGEPVGILDAARTSTLTHTSLAQVTAITGGSYALPAGSVVRAKIWGFFGYVTSAQTLNIMLYQSTNLMCTLTIATTTGTTNNSTNPFFAEFEAIAYTTTSAYVFGRVMAVNNGDAQGDTYANRIAIEANQVISSSAAAWTIQLDWPINTGSSVTVHGGYVEYLIE